MASSRGTTARVGLPARRAAVLGGVALIATVAGALWLAGGPAPPAAAPVPSDASSSSPADRTGAQAPQAAAPTPEAGAAGAGDTVVVKMTDGFKFEPAELEIQAGQTVRWENTGNLPHTVPGKYRYFCIPHELMQMVGTVLVRP